MRDLVLVPSFFRAEFLHVCLEHLGAAEGGKEKDVWVAQDRHHVDHASKTAALAEVRQVAETNAGLFAHCRYIERQPHGFMGNCYNFLELYKEAYNSPEYRYVYLVEDDSIVGTDFFRWHEAVQARKNYFCTVAWHCTRNNQVKPSNDPTAIIESARDFTSQGVCWKREQLHRVAIHAKPEYYSSLSGYMAKTFPNSLIPPTKWTEQAGLIMRLLLQTHGEELVAWPGLRRCAHIGINGYHRRNGYQFGGHLDRRIEMLKSVLGSTSALLNLSTEKYDDVQALAQVDDWEPEKLRVVQHFSYDGSYE